VLKKRLNGLYSAAYALVCMLRYGISSVDKPFIRRQQLGIQSLLDNAGIIANSD
jgi:hypothetical protein